MDIKEIKEVYKIDPIDLKIYCEIKFGKHPLSLTEKEKDIVVEDIISGKYGNLLNNAYLYLQGEWN